MPARVRAREIGRREGAGTVRVFSLFLFFVFTLLTERLYVCLASVRYFGSTNVRGKRCGGVAIDFFF